MIVGYELNRMTRSVGDNKRCMKFFLSSPQKKNHECWRQLVSTSGRQSVGGVYGEEFTTLDESFVARFRSLATIYNENLDKIETYYTSVLEKGNYEYFQETDSDRVNDLISKLDKVARDLDDSRKTLERMTGVEPSGEWGYCNNSDKGRAETYVLKSLRSVDYVREPLRGE